MNFAQYLMMDVSPLPEPPDSPKRRSGNPAPDHTRGNEARVRYSRERLERVLPRDGSWVAGSVIAAQLYTSQASCNSTLYGFRDRDELESRPIDPGKKRNLEWRWKP